MSDQAVAEYTVARGKAKSFYPRYERKSELQHQTHFCPGCGHGNIHKMLAAAIDELGVQDRTIMIGPVGCGVFTYYYFDVGNVQAAHGRAPAVATAMRRSRPESIVISYQGDGDLSAIGSAEILHAANRGENITVIFVNNAVYSMTGGQAAPTTLLGQKSTTTPNGRSPAAGEGYPLHVSELLATLEARAIKRAVENQVRGLGFSLIEVLSPCPTIWKQTPVEAQHWVRDVMEKTFPLGVFCDRTKERGPQALERLAARAAQPEPALADLPRDRAGTDGRHAGAHRGLWRAGRLAARRSSGRGRTRCGPGGFLAAVLRAGDALRHFELPRADFARGRRFAAGLRAQRAGGDERAFAAQVR